MLKKKLYYVKEINCITSRDETDGSSFVRRRKLLLSHINLIQMEKSSLNIQFLQSRLGLCAKLNSLHVDI